MTDLTIITTNAIALAEPTEAAKEFARESVSTNTLRAYRFQVEAWKAWAEKLGHSILPANPIHVASWLGQRADTGTARATIAVAAAAMKWLHANANQPYDGHHIELKKTLRGIMRSERTARLQRQAKPLTAAMLRKVLDANTVTPHEKRDACIVAMLYSFGLRRSELTTLDYQSQGDGLGIFFLDGDLAKITLLRSKTSQDAAQTVSIERDTNPRAFATIEAWLTLASIEPGTPVIRGIDPAGNVSKKRLHDYRISCAVKSAVERYYLREGTDPVKARALASAYSGHSGRVGFVVSAVESGASDTSIMGITRHRDPAMVSRYGKEARARLASPHRIKGVGV